MSERETLFHFRHRWLIEAKKQILYSDISFGRELATEEHKTRLLYRCSVCGKYKTKLLDGAW